MNYGIYKTLEKIGEGSQSLVFKSINTTKPHDGLVALKVLNKDPELYTEIKREAKIYDLIASKGISGVTPCLDRDKENKIPEYFVMPLREYNLEKIIGNLKHEDKINYSLTLLQTLKNIHFYNIVHRDLKPSNILITEDQRVEITDFGIGKQETNFSELQDETIHKDSNFTGTEHYFAPEQLSLKKDKVSQKQSDVFSLSICIYRIFSNGKRLFIDYKKKEIDGLESINKYSALDIDSFLKKGLYWDYKKRYKDGSEMLKAFESILYNRTRVEKVDFNSEEALGNLVDTSALDRGKTYFKLDQYDQALDCFDQIIESLEAYPLPPEDKMPGVDMNNLAQAFLYKGKTLSSLNRYEEACETFLDCQVIDPGLIEAYYGRAKALENLSYDVYSTNGEDQHSNSSLAEIEYNNIIKLNNNDINIVNFLSEKSTVSGDNRYFNALVEISKLYFDGKGVPFTSNKNNTKKALKIIQRVDPETIKKYFNFSVQYGDILYELSLFQEAINYYDYALKIYPYDGKIIRYKANCFTLLADLIEEKSERDLHEGVRNSYKYVQELRLKAVEYYYKAIECDPDQMIAYRKLGQVLRDIGQYDESIKILEKCIKIFPNYFRCFNTLGLTYKDKENYTKAIEIYKRGLVIAKAEGVDYSLPLNNIAKCYINLKKYEEAIKYCKKKIKIDPKNRIAHNHMAQALAELKKYEEAIKYCKKSIELEPDKKIAHNRLVHILNLNKNYNEAIVEANKALKLFPNYSTLLLSTAEVYFNLKEYDKAEHYVDISLDINSASKTARKLKIDIFKKQGLEEEINAELNKYMDLDIQSSFTKAEEEEEFEDILDDIQESQEKIAEVQNFLNDPDLEGKIQEILED